MTLTLQDLKSHLWDCAEILRGSAVDRTDWKAYILPLLFFKRICDVWDEEAAEAAKLFGDADPARRQWVEHRALAEAGDSQAERHVGEVLQFSSPDGQTRMAATVAGLDGPRVLLDFNHPLAGQVLNFEVQIIGIL